MKTTEPTTERIFYTVANYAHSRKGQIFAKSKKYEKTLNYSLFNSQIILKVAGKKKKDNEE